MGVEVQNPNPLSAFQNAAAAPKRVRKTIAFDGSANNGNLGDDVPLFTITGRVLVVYATAYVSEALVCAAYAGTALRFYAGVGGNQYPFELDGSFGDFTGATGWIDEGILNTYGSGYYAFLATPLNTNFVLVVADLGGGADVTDGTIVFDVWYYPITDDGALVAA